MNPLQAIRSIVDAQKKCPDITLPFLLIECPFCHVHWDASDRESLEDFIQHFDKNWDTHMPDGFLSGVPFQIVRRV